MEIFIGNLPDQFNKNDLNNIVRFVLLPNSFSELMRRFLSRKNRLSDTRFELIDNSSGQFSVRYAHAVIHPDSMARRVIQRLDHLTFKGASLRAREYKSRNHCNDRRQRRGKSLYSVAVYNRRRSERRHIEV